MTFFKGIHFSNNKIESGSIIISNQDENPDFDKIWKVYKEVANELGIYFPNKYGYAYSLDKDISKMTMFNHKYDILQTEEKCVTKVNYNYSLLIIFEDSFFSPMSLKYALKNLNKVKEHALKYFTELNTETIEYISDKFIIK